MKHHLWAAAGLMLVSLGACEARRTSDPASAALESAKAQNAAPNGAGGAPVVTTGSMSSGTVGSDTVVGAPKPGTTRTANAH